MKCYKGLIILVITLVITIACMSGCITIVTSKPSSTPLVPEIPAIPSSTPTPTPTSPTTSSPSTTIIIPIPTVTFAVTSAIASVDLPVYSGGCPKRLTFTALISTNGPGTVTYRWERSDGSPGPVQTLVFPSAGTQSAGEYWQLGGSYSGWDRIHILTPNDLLSNQAGFNLICAASVTNASASVNSPSGPCPRTYTFTGSITTDGACTVTYRWERSDGSPGPVQAINFPSAGSVTVSEQWMVGGNYSGWERLHILTPTDGYSNPANFTQVCSGGVTNISVTPSVAPGGCPRTFTFTGIITASGPCTVTYRWERSDGASSPLQSLTFPGAGSVTVTQSWQTGISSGWMQLHVLTPNELVSGHAPFSQTCP
jgi:hypothetical protein